MNRGEEPGDGHGPSAAGADSPTPGELLLQAGKNAATATIAPTAARHRPPARAVRVATTPPSPPDRHYPQADHRSPSMTRAVSHVDTADTASTRQTTGA
jgi:hypothetical protein